jgi:hypothetical protein
MGCASCSFAALANAEKHTYALSSVALPSTIFPQLELDRCVAFDSILFVSQSLQFSQITGIVASCAIIDSVAVDRFA